MRARAAVACCKRMLRRCEGNRQWRARVGTILNLTRKGSASRDLWKGCWLVGSVVLIGALEGIAGDYPSRARSGLSRLAEAATPFSRHLDEWCCSFLSQDARSSYDISGAPIQASATGTSPDARAVLLQGDSGDSQDGLYRRLCWYVGFSDLFSKSRHMTAGAVADTAAMLMQEAMAWRLKSGSGDNFECPDGVRNRTFPFFRQFFPSSGRRRCNNSTTRRATALGALPEKPDVKFTWIDAPKSKGRALVCVAPNENLAVVAVRGSVNIRNILMALKIWPQTRAKDDGVEVSVHSGFAEVADEMMVKIEPLLARGMTIHLTGHSLGGAVSTILALRLKAKGYDISQVVAFGMPLVIWGADEELPRLDIPLLRVEHPLDPIVHFPPAPVHALGMKCDDSKKSKARYRAVGRRVSVGSREAPPKMNPIPFNLNRGVAAHRLRSYSEHCTQCSMMAAA